MIEFRIPTDHDILHLTQNMRQCDVIECAALGATPSEAIQAGLGDCLVAVADGVPFCIFGVCGNAPWALGTDTIADHGRAMVKYGKKLVNSHTCRLENVVHADNHVSIRWLKRIGFTIGELEPLGINGEPFRRFHRCASQ